MSGGFNLGSNGTGTTFDQLVNDYFPEREGNLIYQLLENETDALLAAILLEMQAMNGDSGTPYAGSSVSQQDAVYFADAFQVTADGPDVDGDHVDGTRLDLGFVCEEVDLRFTDDIAVAFRQTGDHKTITYRQEDSPVVGIGASTQYVWIKKADTATSTPTVHLEAW